MSNDKKYNRRIRVVGYGTTQNAIGSPVATIVADWKMWADVRDRSGSSSNPFQQTVWQYNYEISVRYERSRKIGSNYLIQYDGKMLVIDSVSIKSEGYRAEAIIRCHGVDDSTGTGGGGSVVPLPQIGVYDYTGIGGEQEFTASVLAGRYVFSASKAGLIYKILRETGDPGPENEVLNTKSTGRMFWSNEFSPDEQAIVLYL